MNGQQPNAAPEGHRRPEHHDELADVLQPPPRVLSDEELKAAVRLEPREVEPFRALFQRATGDPRARELPGRLAVTFFSRSGLPSPVLKTVWQICDRNGNGHLTRSEFVLAVRLVGLAQVGVRPSLETLIGFRQPFPIPRFELPENIYTDDFDVTEAERAIKHEYDVGNKSWRRTLVNVVIERQAFAEGAMRAAYHMRDLSATGDESRYVAKISKDTNVAPSQYFDDVRMQSEAQKWAERFNERGVPKKVQFIGAYVMELPDRPNRPICGVERYVPGEYVKYNNNWDWSDDRRNTPQAFSHFTWEASRHQLLICDIQGVADMYTDPQIHSLNPQTDGYGLGNLGIQGIDRFLGSHTCNHICRFLGLPARQSKLDAAGTVAAPAVRRNHGPGTMANSRAMVPAQMEQVVQQLQAQYHSELQRLQREREQVNQLRMEKERRQMQEQQHLELQEQKRRLDEERRRLEEEMQQWLAKERLQLAGQMEERLKHERERLEQQARGAFVAAEGPLDRPVLGPANASSGVDGGGARVRAKQDNGLAPVSENWVSFGEDQDEVPFTVEPAGVAGTDGSASAHDDGDLGFMALLALGERDSEAPQSGVQGPVAARDSSRVSVESNQRAGDGGAASITGAGISFLNRDPFATVGSSSTDRAGAPASVVAVASAPAMAASVGPSFPAVSSMPSLQAAMERSLAGVAREQSKEEIRQGRDAAFDSLMAPLVREQSGRSLTRSAVQ